MGTFPMCPACAAEYHDPGSRRFQAQPIACPACGPVVWFARSGDVAGLQSPRASRWVGSAAIEAARDALRAGEIVAVKGVGGFHLACDATSAAAVDAIRRRKRRLRKPFAVMVADVAAACTIAVVDEQERRLLEGRERPIVLLRRRATPADPLAEEVAQGAEFLGVMLPSSPMHHLLGSGLPPLVMTSGNLADEPMR
ncbi:MAG: Sua5/YciO/YrdC/YwlC family protein [Planctomycetota bacterium]